MFGGIIVGLGVAALHNRFYRIELPSALSFFGGTRFVPIISTVVYLFAGILLYYVWPTVQNGIYAMGGFVTGSGYFGTLLFGLVLHLFTPGGYVSYTTSVTGFLGYLIFPSVAIALPKAAMAIKLLRTSVLSEMKLDYVRTAYSRGNNTKGVLYQHVLRNAIIPVITFLGMALADMVAGSIVIEQVFNIPGLGRILLTSISNRDYPVVQAIIVFIAFIVIFTNFLVDLLYQKMDPRITLD